MERNNQKNEKLSFIKLMDHFPENLNRVWSVTIIDQLIKSGIVDFVLSPGMRNAPLIYALTQAQDLNVIDIFDERAAAYRALGIAKAKQKPVVLICTSGTALANYTPAVVEAFHTDTPLIILSADRPTQLVHNGANQSMYQDHFYGNNVIENLNLPLPNVNDSLEWCALTISHLTSKLSKRMGPAHINIPFREPLDASLEEVPQDIKNSFFTLLKSERPYFYSVSEKTLNRDFTSFLNNNEKLLISVGDLNGALLSCEELAYLEQLNAPLYFDVTSSSKYSYNLLDNSIPSFDHPEVFQQWDVDPPNGILHIGGRMTSKHYYRFLEKHKDIEIFHIANLNKLINPSNSPILYYQGKVSELFAFHRTYSRDLKQNNYEFIKTKSNIIDESDLSFPSLSKSILELINNNENLFIANSTLIRSFDLYSSFHNKKDLNIYSNRGVSGIEGLISTAVGIAQGKKEDITIVIGDISLLHDLNSLSMLKDVQQRIKIILANNYGGGIFNLLPISKEKDVLKHMQTAHEHNFKNIAESFGFYYQQVSSKEDFQKSFCESASSKNVFIEVLIDDQKNKELYDKLKTVKL